MEWWEFFLGLFLLMPILVLWVATMVDVFGRSDLSVIMKVVWLFGIWILPLIGPLIYIFTRPRAVAGDRLGPMDGMWSTDPNQPNRVT